MMSKAIIKILLITTSLSLGIPGFSQTEKEIIQLKNTVNTTSSDTERTNALISICFFYLSSNPDSGLYYGDLALQASRAAGYSTGEVKALNGIAAVYSQMGTSDKSLQNLLEAIKICEGKSLTAELQNTLGNMGSLYAELADYRQSIYYYLRSIDIAERNNIGKSTVGTYHIYLGQIYTLVGVQDSALFHVRKGYEILQKIKLEDEYANAFSAFGDIYSNRSDNGTALHYYYLALEESRKFQRDEIVCETLLKMAKVFNKMGRGDSALLCAKESLWSARNIRYTRIVKEAGEFLTNYYKENNNTDSAFKYIEVLMVAKDSLFSEEKIKNIKDLQFSEHIRDQELAAQSQAFRNRTKFIILGSILFLFVIVLVVLWRNNRLKQKAFNSLRKQKEQTDIQKDKADKALMELKGTQAQLIQSEKMASLGELTAGIAHEIQNPLNFVNNFSEVNNELIEELKIKKSKLKTEDNTEEIELLNDIYQNNEKINHHGKRADAIVKGMLQHSRNTSGVKGPTDINALADEYLRLAYHGLRAKDKSFNAEMKTDFDKTLSAGEG
ncbi:MAG TPA: hypothetical protein VK588_14695, partial [Chitinophagaceae bacterium]|nr:hypothetical protein [Chitinophagaceae bacterium]